MFGAQKNPFDVAGAIPNFRQPAGRDDNVGLWRADVLAAFDCLAYGGAFAAIGAGGSLRHLVPADEKPEADNPVSAHACCACCRRCCGTAWDGSSRTSTRTPRLLAAAASSAAGHRWIASTASTATCVPSPTPTTPRYGPAGCPACSATLLPQMGRYGGVIVCRAAVDEQENENIRLRQKGAFKPSPALKKLATLPVTGEADELRASR